MKTKIQIIAELLDKKAITAEEAVVLLTPDEPSKNIIYGHPLSNPWKPQPYTGDPLPNQDPIITCKNGK